MKRPPTIDERVEKLERYARSQRKRAWFDPSPKTFTTVVTSYLSLADGAIVGDQDGLTVHSKWIKSDNFASGADGWRVLGDGTAEFNSVVVRGTVYATAGEVGGWTINADTITGGNATLHSSGYLNLGTVNDIVRIDAADATYRLWVGHATAASAPFRVTKAGALTATSATITGTITSEAGTIGGWTLAAASLAGGDAVLHSTGYLALGTGNDYVRLDAVNATHRLWVGHATAGSAPFRVTKGGALTATSATITGTIDANAGHIGTLDIDGVLTVGAAPCIQLDGPNKRLESSNFASGVSGFRIDHAGEAEFNNVVVRGGLHTAVFIHDEVHVQAGRLLVSPNAGTLGATLTTAATGSFNTGEAGRFAANDIVRLKDGTSDAWLTVNTDNADGTYNYTLSSGATGQAFTAGTAVVSYGASGEGCLLLNASDADAPFLDIFTHAGSPWTTQALKVRIGNLAGVTDADLSPSGYGLYTDNVFLKGKIISTAGEIGGWTLAATSLTGGNAILHSTGYLALGTGNDYVRLDAADATYRLWVGHATAASAPFRVTKAGALTSISGTIGSWSIGSTTLLAGNVELDSVGIITVGTVNDIARLSAYDATYRLWVGHALPASAPFRVTKAGALTATSATITGTITSEAGTIGGWTLAAASLAGGNATLNSTGYLALGTGNDYARLDAANATHRLWVGHATAGSAPFRVTKAGALTATSATITGEFNTANLTLNDSGFTLSSEMDITYTSTEASAVTVQGVEVELTLNPGSHSSATFNAFRGYAFTSATAVNYSSIRGAYMQARHKGTGTVASLVGTISLTKMEGAGTVTSMIGWSAYAGASAGSITTCQGAVLSFLSGGTVTGNLYGLTVNSSEALTVNGDRYGLYVAGSNTRNVFLGTLAVSTGLWIGRDAIADNNDLHIDGSINKSTALGCAAYRSTVQSVASHTWTALSFNVQLYDTDGGFAPTSTKLYARHAGYYSMGGCVLWASAQGTRIMTLAKNGAKGYGRVDELASGVTVGQSLNWGFVWMDVDDYMEVFVYQTSGGNLNTGLYGYSNAGWLTRIA